MSKWSSGSVSVSVSKRVTKRVQEGYYITEHYTVAVFEPPISYHCEFFLFHEAVAVCQRQPQTQSYRGCNNNIREQYIRLCLSIPFNALLKFFSLLFVFHETMAVCQCRPHTQSYRGCNRDMTSESIKHAAVSEPPISYPFENVSLLFLFKEAVAECLCRPLTQSQRGSTGI